MDKKDYLSVSIAPFSIEPFRINPVSFGEKDSEEKNWMASKLCSNEKTETSKQEESDMPPVIELCTENVKTKEAKKEHILPSVIDQEILQPVQEHMELADGDRYVQDESLSARKPEFQPLVSDTVKTNQVSNYCILPVVRRIYIDRTGRKIHDRETTFCTILIDGREHEGFDLLTKDICQVTKLVQNRYAEARLNYAVKGAADIIEDDIRRRIQTVPIIYCFTDQGWQSICGKPVYIYDGMKQNFGHIETGFDLPCYGYTPKQIEDAFWRAFDIYEGKEEISTILLFSLLGVAYRVFLEAGFAPRFILFLNGKTGSFKTTLGKIFYIQLADEEHRKKPRSLTADTITSFERAAIKSGRDTVTFFDDFAPPQTVQKGRELKDKLESIVRMYGDGNTRSRSNPNLDDIQGEGVQGVAVVTGEIRGKGVSSNLRCVYCEICREKVNLENVTWFQENEFTFTTFIGYFAEYLGANWKKTINQIKETYPGYRKELQKELKEYRIIDSAVTLHILADILKGFLIQYCGTKNDVIEPIINDMKRGVVFNCRKSELIATEDSPAVKFVKGIDTLICQGEIVLCEKKDFDQMEDADGFIENGAYFFVPQRVYGKVMKYFGTIRDQFYYNLYDLVQNLADERIITTHSNGSDKRTNYARKPFGKGIKYSFLEIREDIFKAVVEDNFEDGGMQR